MLNNKIIVLMIGLIAGDFCGVIETCVVMHIHIKKNHLDQSNQQIQLIQTIPEIQYVQQVKTVEVVRVQIETNKITRTVTNFVQLPAVIKTVIQKEYVVREVQREPEEVPEKPHHCRIYRMVNGKYVEDPKYMEGKMEY